MLAHDLPLEIWQQIFAHACCDGGRTGASLALVSHFVHRASFPVRFRSLAFSSLRQIRRFFAFIDAHPCRGHLPPKVYHLLLSFTDPSRDAPECEWAGAPALNHGEPADGAPVPGVHGGDPHVWVRIRAQRAHAKLAWDREFLALVPRLLALAAPHLETLAVLQSDGHAIPTLALAHGVPLPRLRELTLLAGIAAMLDCCRDPCARRDAATPDARSRPPSESPPKPHPGPRDAATPAHVHPLSLSPTADASLPRLAGSEAMEHAPGPDSCTETCAAVGRFPALERLHVVCGRHRDWTLRGALACVRRAAPALTHLRISNATYTHGRDGCVAAFLRRVLPLASAPAIGRPRGGWDGDGEAAAEAGAGNARGAREDGVGRDGDADADGDREGPEMPALSRIIVHSVPPPAGGRCENPYEDYRALVRSVCTMEAACGGSPGDIRMRWVESERLRHRDWEQMIGRQWVERVQGGSGCWEGFGDD